MRQLWLLLGLAAGCWAQFPVAPEEDELRSDGGRPETGAVPLATTALIADTGSGRPLDTSKAAPSKPDASKGAPSKPDASKAAPSKPDLSKPPPCPDSDGDGWSGCAGDCDDGNSLVHPGQKLYFAKPTAKVGFDYDCDGHAELQLPAKAACTAAVGGCSGEGWEQQVPACGKQAKWVVCLSSYKKGILVCKEEDEDDAASRTQACR
jgi:hypothetical protein